MITLKSKVILEKMMKDLPRYMTKNELIDWLLKNEYDRKFSKITVIELIQVAKHTGIEIKGYEECEKLDIKKLKEKENERTEFKNKLKDMYRNKKMSVVDIAKELNIAREKVYDLFNVYGIHQKEHKYTKNYIQTLYDNYSVKEIKDKFHISHKTFYKFLNIYNIPRKTNRGRKRQIA